MESEMKPCPFCGSDNVQAETANNEGDWRVTCQVCGISGPESDSDHDNGKAEAIAAWNNRIAPRSQPMTQPPTTPAKCPNPNCICKRSLFVNGVYKQSDRCKIEEQRQEIAASELQIADLAQLVRRLLHRTSPELIHKIDGLNKLREQAQDYLNRKGLQGSILREESP